MSSHKSSRTAEKQGNAEPEPAGKPPPPEKKKTINSETRSAIMDVGEESSEISSDLTVASSSDNTGRSQPVVNISKVQNYQNVSNNRNVVFGDKVIKITKTDGRASNIKESTRLALNSVDWRVYVETRAEKRGVELLKKHGVVIVVGCPGSGKTTLVLSIMRQTENEEKREPYKLTHHSDFYEISLAENKKCVVLIDDIFGKTNLTADFMSSWQLKFPDIWNHVQNGSLKCIITLRKQIFSEAKTGLKEFGLFNENHVLDLQSDDCCLLRDEKEKILNNYLELKNVKMNKNGEYTTLFRSSCEELGFPQICVYYVNSSDAQKRGVKFFEKPVEYLRQQLEHVKNDKSSQINYLVLLLLLFKQGSLSVDSLDHFENDSDSDIMKLVRLLEGACLSLKNTGLTDIKKAANEMCGTYLKCSGNKYTFIHQSVFDCLFLMFTLEFPKKAAELLQVCPVSMLLEYVVTLGVSNKSHITMTVEPDCFDVLARRFTDLLASDKAREIVSHPSLKDDDFLKYLIQEKMFYGRLSEILHQRLFLGQNSHQYISFVHANNANEIFSHISYVFDNDSNFGSYDVGWVRVEKDFIKTSYVASECIVGKLRTLLQFFTNIVCEMELTYQKTELLNFSCLFGDEDVVRMLLKSGVTPYFETFTIAACSKTDSATIFRELIQYKKDMKLTVCSWSLQISICSGNMNIACLLADMINNEEHNHEIKKRAVKLLLVQFHRHVKPKPMKTRFRCPETFKVVDVSQLFKKLVTTDIIKEIKNIDIIAAGQRNSGIIKEIVKLKPDCLNVENRDKVLLAAAIWGSTDTVNFLIEQRQNDTDENNWKKSQTLKAAVMFNSSVVVQSLLDKGADPNVNVAINQKLIDLFEDKTGLKLLPSDSPLHISVLLGDLDMLKSLIKRNADVNAVNSEGKTPLHEAVNAETNRKEIALLLLENGADVNITDKQQNSALHIASQIDIDVVKEVTKRGVEINVINTEGETPLLLSLRNNIPEIALHLLKQGADPNFTDDGGYSVLHTAAEYGNIEIVTALVEKGVDVNSKNSQGGTPLLTSVNYDEDDLHPSSHDEECKAAFYIQEDGADPNLKDSDNISVLHLAAKYGNIELVTALTVKGFDVNIKNRKGETVLLTALKSYIYSFEKHHTWIKTHFDVNTKTSQGETPLFAAVKHGHNKVALYLLDHGAEPNSVLRLAEEMENLEIVTALIEKSVDVNIRNTRGETTLSTVVNYDEDKLHPYLNSEKYKVVFHLLEHGADPNLTDNDNNSALHLAVKVGNTELVEVLIEKGVDVNFKNSQGETPLFTAINYVEDILYPFLNNKICEVALHLLEHGADPHLIYNDKNSALHLAAKYGNKKIVTALIEKGVDINVKNKQGETPLFTAVEDVCILDLSVVLEKCEISLFLLKNGADPNLTDDDNNSVLHLAAKQGNIEIVKVLIKKGVDVNIKNRHGETPILGAFDYDIFDASQSRNDEKCKVVLHLLEHRADPNLTDDDQNSVLHRAAEHGNIEIVKVLIKKGVDVNTKNSRGETPLFSTLCYDKHELYPSLKKEKLKVFVHLLEHGADPNIRRNDKNSLLHLAASCGDMNILRKLIENGCDVNITNSKGETPFLKVLNPGGHKSIITQLFMTFDNHILIFLLEHGADPCFKEKYAKNAVLHFAAKQGNIGIVKALIAKGADVNIKNNRGETPLFAAVNYEGELNKSLNNKKCKVVFHLLEHGADPNLTDNDNNSVLHLAAEYGNTKIVTALIEKGVDINVKNRRGETPLFTAVKYIEDEVDPFLNDEKCEVVFHLLEHGADPNLTDSDNNSVLHLAVKYGNIEIVKALIEKGVDVNVINSTGETPLDKATSCRFHCEESETILYLLEHGAKHSNR